MWPALCLIVMVNWMLNSLTTGMEHLTTSSWRRLSGQDLAVSGYEVWVRGRSKVECIRECNKYSHCTSFVFNVSSRTCYLQPALDNTANTASLGQVHVNTDHMCRTDNPPSCNGSVTSWHHRLTSLIGDVTCHSDFMNTTSDVTVECTNLGAWQIAGSCLQYKWSNPPLTLFPVAIPLPVRPGWSVCVEGIPTAPIRFTVELMVGADNRALHADFRFQFSTHTERIYTGYKYNGAFSGGGEFTSFPFSVNQPFHLRVKVTETGMYELFVNNTLCASYPHYPSLPATAITSVNVKNDISVTHLNLMCSK